MDKRAQVAVEHKLADAGVACLSGASFGAFGEGFMRFSYANSQENIEAALDAIANVLPGLAK